jgi:hypothetical protein
MNTTYEVDIKKCTLEMYIYLAEIRREHNIQQVVKAIERKIKGNPEPFEAHY